MVHHQVKPLFLFFLCGAEIFLKIFISILLWSIRVFLNTPILSKTCLDTEFVKRGKKMKLEG
jgi:hypothetical protein